jgi:hypothetical protein
MPLISPSWPYATVALKKSPTRPCDLICATQTREGTERSGLAPPFCGTTVLPRCLSQSHERVTGSSIKFLRCSRCAALRNSALGRSNRRPFHLGNNLRKRRVWCSGLDLNQHLRFADQNRRCDSALSPLELPPRELLCKSFSLFLGNADGFAEVGVIARTAIARKRTASGTTTSNSSCAHN